MNEVTQADRQRVHDAAVRLQTISVSVLSFLFKLKYTRTLGHVSAATMCRLLLPTLLPAVDRVIYLDIDTLVLGPLRPLHDFPLPADVGIGGRSSRAQGVIQGWIARDQLSFRSSHRV